MAGLMDFARAHRIDCHLEQPGSITVATAAWQLDDLAEAADLHRDAGDTVTLLDADAVRAEVDSPTYLGGLYERDTALVHPGKLARGLARQFRATFPQLRDVRFDRWWGGAIATTTRFTATFGEALGGRVVYALVYTGLGVARGRCAGPACSSRGVRSRARTAGRAGAGHGCGCGCGCGCSTVSGSVRLGGVGVTAATSTAAPERAKWPRLAGSPHPQLRSLLPRGYACFTEATTPRHLVLPATTLVSLVVKLLDSPHRPPAFVMGAHGSSTFVEGDCAAPSAVLTVQTAGALPSVDEIPTAPRNEPGSDHAAVVATFDI